MDLINILEKEIEKMAKELNINEKFLTTILECDYRAISLTKNSTIGKVVILLKLPTDAAGKENNPIIKSTKEENQELINKMDKFVHLIRVHKALKKAEKAKEDYIVKTLTNSY